jgi:hypothetical protein
MQSVPAPHLTTAPARLPRRTALVLVLAALSALALASGLSSVQQVGGGAPRLSPALALVGGMPLQQARCQQWVGASSSERSAALSALHGVVGGPTPYGPASALSAPEAQRLFDRTCAHPWATNFLLYELYTRASGFRSLVTR